MQKVFVYICSTFFLSLSLCLYTYRFSLICSMHFHPGFLGPFYDAELFFSHFFVKSFVPFVAAVSSSCSTRPESCCLNLEDWRYGAGAHGFGFQGEGVFRFLTLGGFRDSPPSMIESWLMTTKLALHWRRNRLKIRVRLRDPSPLVRLSFINWVLTGVG